MLSSDDEADVGPQSVSNYHFVDDEDAPTSFSFLSLLWSTSESANENKEKQIFLHGSVDKGLQTIHKEVTAWKFDLLNANLDISVLTKENVWIKLEKPRKSFEEIIRTVLITVHCLHFVRRNPEASEKSVWDHLSKVFSSYEVKPSLNDLVDHVALISEAVKRDESLSKSKFLRTVVEEKPRKRKLPEEDVQATAMSGFIVDDVDDEILEDMEDDESDDDNNLFDSVCSFCDNGGTLLCCEGSCMRSFHPTKEAGEDSMCESLGFTEGEVEAMQSFYCKNCELKQHQCFSCGNLGSSDKYSGAEVFRCSNATCGHFYHPRCIAKLLPPGDKVAIEGLEKNIASGESFICPSHKCSVCKEGENKKEKELQFAVCRRCPTSYHRKCLPKEIVFEEEAEEEVIRAWEDLLPNRILIYCLKHEIIDELGTPIRDIRFPGMEENKKKQISELPGSSSRMFRKKIKLASEDSFSGKTYGKELKKSPFGAKEVASIRKSEKMSSALNSTRKLKPVDSFRKSLKENDKSASKNVDRSATTYVNKDSLGNRLYEYVTKRSEEVKIGKQETHTGELDKTMTVKSATKNLISELPSLDADSERRLLALMKDAASSVTMEYVMKKHEVPSTHAYSSKAVVDKTITAGKVEGAVEAVRTALKKLEDGCSIEDAKAVCEPNVLSQVFKWKSKLRVYLAPFLHGMRYTSFGRHFTKPEKLKEIVNMIHWYVQDGDMIVDFCCGANDFSWQMKEKLEETRKKCSYKNYDFIQPKNDFNFEKRDWMTVRPSELPKKGSHLIMGLNPPFGVKAALANKFIDKALEFKPKLLILIVPPETERLDKKNTPYDLVWKDDEFMSGKSFYLPGSVDDNDKQMEQWNVTAPPLYLWSRRDWSVKHKGIAKKHGHISRQTGPSSPEINHDETKIHDHPAEVDYYSIDALEVPDDRLHNKEPNGPSREISVGEVRKGYSPHDNRDRESQDSHGPETSQSKEASRKEKLGEDKPGRGMNTKLSENRGNGGKSPGSDTHTRTSHRSPSNAVNGRSSQEPEVADDNLPNLQSGIYSSHMPYGSSYPGNLNRKYSMDDMDHAHGVHGFSHANLEDRSSLHIRESAESIGYRSYITELNRESNMLPQDRHYGQDPNFLAQRNYMGGHDPGYGQMGSLSTPYGHPRAAADSSYRMGMSAMQRYAPRLDELNHIGMSNIGPGAGPGPGPGPGPSMLNRNDMYDPRPPRPGYHVDSMGFAPGPYHPYAHHNSAGWLHE